MDGRTAYLRQLSRTIVLLLAPALLLCTGARCDNGYHSTELKSFPQEVIDAGRGLAAPARAGQPYSSTSITLSPFRISKAPPATPSPEPKPIAAIPATKDGILKAIRLIKHARTSKQRGTGQDSIVALDMKALQPMLAMLNEDTLSQRNAYSIVRLLIRLGRVDRDQSPYGDFAPQSADTRPLTPQADEIACTIARYALRNPDQQLNMGNLSNILPLSRLPQVIEWARSASGTRQRDFILLFSHLTHTRFPTIPIESCGNATCSSKKEALKRRTEQQNASIAMMQEWWSDNGQRPYSSWLIDRLNSVIDHEVESLPGLLQRFEGMPRMQAVYRRRPARWRHSLSAATFDALCARLTDAPQYVRPYILGLIGHCDHPKRTEFIAGFLQQSDEDLQQAAIEILGPENAKDYAADILRILTTSQDSLLLENTIETAGQFDDPTLIAPIAAHLPSQDPYVRDAAQTAVRRLLFNHSAQIEKLSHSYKDKLVRQQLANILNVRKAEKESDELLNRQMGNQERLSLAYRLLLSNDREARRQAIELIRRHDLAELLPICADLLPTADQTTRSRIASLLTHKGIPDLTVARAEELFGYSLELDQRMALYCHAQYGDEALPLVRKVAFQWRDPAKPETVEVGRRTKDLITILRNAGEPNLDQRIVAMIREFIDIDRALSYGYLLSTLGHETPTDFIDDLLADESRHKRSHAIWLTCRLGLEQYADQLAQLAPSLYCERPYVVATLIDFGHPQAWPATVSLLDSYALRLGHGNICGPPPDTAFQFGLKLADLKPSHKQQLLQTFQSELEGKKNEGILIALTAALVRDPDAADREWLLQLASKQEVPLSVRTLAAIALSRLGDPSCLPHLQRLLRSYSSGQSNHADAYNARARLGTDEFNAYQTARADVYALDRRLMQRRRSEPWRIFTETPTEYADVVHALHTLGDESMAAELADALIAPDGDWNEQAYALLLQLKGMEGYRAACNRIEAVAPDMLDLWTRVPRDFVGVDMTPVEAMQILTFKETQLYDEALLIIKNNLKQAADPLVELYERCNNNGTPHTDYRSTILDALCQLGDRRGLDLAVDNPLLFLEMATYLADPPVPAIYHQGFKFNNIQTAVTIRDWYLQHRDQLVWNQSTSSFCLAPISPGSREGAGLN